MLLGERERMIAQAKRAAEDRDLALGPAGQSGRRYNRRRHHAVRGLMMLVDRHTVEAELIAEFELIEIEVVGLMPELLIVMGVGECYPGALGVELVGQRRIGKQVKVENLHGPISCNYPAKARTASATASAFSTCSMCPV